MKMVKYRAIIDGKSGGGTLTWGCWERCFWGIKAVVYPYAPTHTHTLRSDIAELPVFTILSTSNCPS